MLTVKRIFVGSLTIAALTMASSASALLLTFEDTGASNFSSVPSGYGGLDWSTLWLHNNNPVGSGYDTGRVSGDFAVFNPGAAPSEISSASSFDFTSAYLTSAWNTGLNITVNGYNGGSLLYSNTVIVNSSGPTNFVFDYLGVDSVTFTSFGGVDDGNPDGAGTHFVMDDVVINESTPVPEPATLLLLGMGLSGLAARKRLQKK